MCNYKECEVNFGNDKAPSVQAKITKMEKEEVKQPAIKSKLHPSVQELINFINDSTLIENSIVKIGYDPKKLPLGQLSDKTIKEGLTVLKKIEAAIKKKNKDLLNFLCNEFYMIIPHDFGFKHMSQFKIDTMEKL